MHFTCFPVLLSYQRIHVSVFQCVRFCVQVCLPQAAVVSDVNLLQLRSCSCVYITVDPPGCLCCQNAG